MFNDTLKNKNSWESWHKEMIQKLDSEDSTLRHFNYKDKFIHCDICIKLNILSLDTKLHLEENSNTSKKLSGGM